MTSRYPPAPAPEFVMKVKVSNRMAKAPDAGWHTAA